MFGKRKSIAKIVIELNFIDEYTNNNSKW